ncbi:hypothetical protein CLV51_1011062 [Chitinophaga niastensis]|uniref:Cell shape-determining protein MreB n=1 Tax=Chitinophaga niastensis TaxID=536980 RepID=A0A2P8HU23_CHINA|nr:hypothetical protein [Chitinophaga niastensis]PSL49727.1 hypothetical protein CLV51_1011062 [Chitinophaga niastensis]
MKTKSFGLALLSVAALTAAIFSSCKKENRMNDGRAVSASQVIPSSAVLSGVLGTGHAVRDTILLTSGIEWHLSGLVYVDSSDVLIIQPGTRILGDVSPTAGVAGGGLIVTKNAKILADGQSATTPIVFTSERWNTTPASGDWSGVVLLGNAPTNVPTTTRVEGVTDLTPADATFGGSNAADNSGILRYVRIEYAGFALSLNNELNGLTLAGVGNGTTIDYVEVFKANDDAFEWFGGTVNASHLLAIDALDDMFDTDNGYSGTISYALGLSDTTRADQSQSNGFESDNNATGTTATPVTHAKYNNITIVGLPNAAKASITNGAPSGTGKYGRAAHLRRNAEFEIKNAIFLGFNNGVVFDTNLGSTYTKFTSGISTASGNYVHGFVNAYATENGGIFTNLAAPTGNTGYIAANPNGSILLASPFNRSSAANFVPGALAPAGVKASGAFPTGNTTWANGWSKFN